MRCDGNMNCCGCNMGHVRLSFGTSFLHGGGSKRDNSKAVND
jgi:hypothetical protein